jgi:tRNA dimethylallyltransferase
LKKTNSEPILIIITGPTAVGKTDLSVEIAHRLGTGIVSADARQFYREMKIGTAPPSPALLNKVPHFFIGHLSIFEYYNVSLFEQQALAVIDGLFARSGYAVVTGGSGLYLDTLCDGIGDLPDADPATRAYVQDVYRSRGIEGLRNWLKSLDPAYYGMVDLANPKRLMRGIEVFLSTGIPFSALRNNQPARRNFRIQRIVLNRDRKELFRRINDRVDSMVSLGLIEEAVSLFPYRDLNALNTVGYKELFGWLSNHFSLAEAVEKIRTNTRRYAKRQLTWFKRYNDAAWFHPDDVDSVMDFIDFS